MSYTELELRTVRSREAIRLSPMVADPDCLLRFGCVEEYWRSLSAYRRSKGQGQLALVTVGNVTYVVANFKTFELAWPIWLGSVHSIARTFLALDSDEKIKAFEERCHALGNMCAMSI